MGTDTKIAWTNRTFSPWRGCTKVSPGCANCYAEDLTLRHGENLWGPGAQRRRTSTHNWTLPLRWDAAAAMTGVQDKVFCSSLSDWLDPEVPAQWLADLLALIAATPHLDWLLLTKRPELWRSRLQAAQPFIQAMPHDDNNPLVDWTVQDWLDGTPPANVVLGTTVEDQQRADERIPALLSIPARVRFLSCEPLLERVLLDNGDTSWLSCRGGCSEDRDDAECCGSFNNVGKCFRGIDWLVCGGESGSSARPFDLSWARALRDQCAAAGVAFFFKQLGNNPTDGGAPLAIEGHHGADPTEWPADLRVQQFYTK